MKLSLYIILSVMLAFTTEAAVAAQTSDAEIVVTARRSGAPMWTIATPRGMVLLVGEINDVPKATPWHPDRLQVATESAQRVILGTKTKVSPGDLFRLIFKGGKLTRLPKGKVAADYLADGQRWRLAALEARFGQDYSRRNFLMTAVDFLSKRLAFNRNSGTDASEIVRKAARQAKISTRPVASLRGEDLLDNLFAAVPESHLPCLDAAMTAVEEGPAIVEQRGIDWREFDIPAVMANPLERALGQCWPWADSTLGLELRDQWVDSIQRATEEAGVTLAVVPLRVLAEADGVLDQLQLRGHALTGPAWRSSRD